MRTPLLALLFAGAACGTGAGLDDAALVEQRRAELESKDVVEGLALARTALEIAGVLPNYSCGPIDGALGRAIPPVTLPLSCITVATREGGMDLTFQPGGCEVATHRVEGRLGVDLGVGEDRIEAHADLRQLSVDGQTVPVKVGVGVCGDEKRVFATVDPVRIGSETFSLEARAGYRAGLPLIGSKSVVLDGQGSLSGSRVSAQQLEYELGAPLPKSGSLTVDRPDGSGFTLRFTEVLWKLGKAELTVHGQKPIEGYVLR